MPDTNSQEPDNEEMKKLLQAIWPEIPAAVRKACHSLKHFPDQPELDGFVQRTAVLLMDNDCHTLRSYVGHSEPQTWLFTIARRHISRLLREQSRRVSLDEMSPDSLVSQPDQEEMAILAEMKEQLHAAASQLTEHERKFLDLLMQGLKTEEIAEAMGIKKTSARTERSALIKKLQRIVKGE